MRKTHDAVATVGTWTDETGKKNKRTIVIGALFESEHGRLVLHLDAVPVSRDWSGWVALKERRNQPDETPEPGEDIPFQS